MLIPKVTSPTYYFVVYIMLLITITPILQWFAPEEWFKETKQTTTPRDKKLEGMRGLLAPSVMLYHGLISYFYYLSDQKWEMPPSSFYIRVGTGPVMVFFFLTGYFFWRPIALSKGVENSNWSTKNFLIRRYRRLAPGFYLMTLFLFVSVMFCSQWRISEPWVEIINELISWLTFGLPYGLFQQMNQISYTAVIVAGVVWSIRFEWLFYLSFPFIRKLSRPLVITQFLIGALGLWQLLSTETVNAFISNNPFWKSGLITIRDHSKFLASGFSVGIWAAILKESTCDCKDSGKNNCPCPWYSKFLKIIFKGQRSILVGALLLILFVLIPIIEFDFVISFIFLGIPFLAIVLSDPTAWRVLEARPLQLLGQISYGIYLFHGIMIFWVLKWANEFWHPIASLNPPAFWTLVYLAAVLTFALAFMSYRYVELKWMRKS